MIARLLLAFRITRGKDYHARVRDVAAGQNDGPRRDVTTAVVI